MDYSYFINIIMKQDCRNIIEKTSRKISDLPKQLSEFYSQYEPKDVEILLSDFSAVKIYPYKYLHRLQDEYKLGEAYFVFATKNSDPIAIYNQQIVTASHGTDAPEIEVIAKSFDDYINKLMKSM